VSTTGVILAGGRGTRMGGIDKGLQKFAGRTLIECVIERVRPQVDDLLVNANRNTEQYQELGYPVIADRIGGFAGPLAGLHAALSDAHSAFVATFPCDSPFVPLDLVSRLLQSLSESEAEVAVATIGKRMQPVFSVCLASLRVPLEAFLLADGRKFEDWIRSRRLVEVSFDDQAAAFRNINTVEDLRRDSER
jgi:molybdopterin-guanine dinucleotide biosynthesis protein A